MNSSQRLAVTRYAAAYDSLSDTNEDASRRAKDLADVAASLSNVNKWLGDPGIPLAKKQKAVRAALAQKPQVGAFVEVLLEAKRYALLPQIVEQVARLLDNRLGIVRAKVISAGPLSAEQQAKTVRALEQRYEKKVAASFETDTTLLGGLKIWCCGELIDGSIQGEFARLEEVLTK